MLNTNPQTKSMVKEYMVTCYLDGKQVFCKAFKASKGTVLAKCKQWYWNEVQRRLQASF